SLPRRPIGRDATDLVQHDAAEHRRRRDACPRAEHLRAHLPGDEPHWLTAGRLADRRGQRALDVAPAWRGTRHRSTGLRGDACPPALSPGGGPVRGESPADDGERRGGLIRIARLTRSVYPTLSMPDDTQIDGVASAGGLTEMLRGDQRLRWQQGQRVPVEAY